MKRKRPIEKSECSWKYIFPLFFWRECEFCNKDFRREWGYSLIYYYMDCRFEKYCCNSCADTPEEAEHLYNQKKKWI